MLAMATQVIFQRFPKPFGNINRLNPVLYWLGFSIHT